VSILQLVYHGTNELQQATVQPLLYQLITLNCWVLGGYGSICGTGLKRQGHRGGHIRVGQWLFTESTETIQYFNVNTSYLPIE